MALNQTTHVYEYVIGGQQASTHVEYRITAYDNAGNQITHSNDEQYTVIPEFQTGAVIIAIALSTSMAFIVRRKKHSHHRADGHSSQWETAKRDRNKNLNSQSIFAVQKGQIASQSIL
jgi:orotate phosphoribosyltransferase